MDVRPQALLRWWFGLFDHTRLALVARVISVGSAAVVTATGLGTVTRTRWWAHLPLAVVTWALLGKIEGDARDSLLGGDPAPDGPWG